MVKQSGSKIVMGLELPEDIIGDDEKGWNLLDFDMSSPDNREKSLAFARILGFLLADGWIGERQAEACFGTLLDAKMFADDVELLTGKKSTIRERTRDTVKGSTFTINVLSEIVRKIISLDGIVQGKRSTQKPSLPTFLFEDSCPVSILREFLGGLFGGDGCAPFLIKGDKKANCNSKFGPINLKWDTIEKYGQDMSVVMDQLCHILQKLGLNFHQTPPKQVKYYDSILKPNFF
jgi:intein/homing endonuclease